MCSPSANHRRAPESSLLEPGCWGLPVGRVLQLDLGCCCRCHWARTAVRGLTTQTASQSLGLAGNEKLREWGLGGANPNKKSREPKESKGWSGAKTSGQVELEEMSSLVKEDLEKKLFKPLSQNLYEFIEIEFSVQDRYYLCVSGNLFFLLSLQNVNNSTRALGGRRTFLYLFSWMVTTRVSSGDRA